MQTHKGGCTRSFGPPFLQEIFRRVFPRVWRILFVQIAIAADSLAAAPRPAPRRSFTVFRTFLIQPQNFEAWETILLTGPDIL